MKRQEFAKYAKNIDCIFFKPLIVLAAAITLIGIMVPLAPHMPTSGLDPSWQIAMNYAVSKHISIGKDAIFTFGPFASVYTMQYYPDTDTLMLIGSSLICFGFIAVFVPIVQRSTLIGLGLVYVISISVLSKDAAINTYCFFYVMGCWELSQRPRLNSIWLSVLVIAGAALGLLIAIKLSFLIPSAAAWAAGAALFSLGGQHKRASIIAATAPPLSLLIAWLASGQPFFGLYFYLNNSLSIISGYTDAMSVPGERADVIVYALASVVILINLFVAKFDGFLSRVIITSMFGLFLFLGVKAGFVRHDGHAMSAGVMIGVPALCLGLLNSRLPQRAAVLMTLAAVCVAFVAFVSICHRYGPSFRELVFEIPEDGFARAANGLSERWNGDLRGRFNRAMAEIKNVAALPVLPGTSDIYPFDLADLIASGNDWQPRPVIQSYQAYGSLLAAEAYRLRSANAPTNIFFRSNPIDGHYPLMENGPALPEILARYSLRNIEYGTLTLVRLAPELQTDPKLTALGPPRYATFGRAIDVPPSDGAVFAVFTLDRSTTSKLMSLAFKTPPLSITVTLADGSDYTFRVIPGMIEQGFILSPLIENVEEFARLFAKDNLARKSVKALRLNQEDHLGKLPGTYHVAFYGLALTDHASNMELRRFERQSPTGLAPLSRACVESLDALNGSPPAQTNQTNGSLTAEGWLALDVKKGLLPEQTYLTLKNKNGDLYYFRANRISRGDVASYFHVADLIRSGFMADASTSDLPRGPYTLGFAVTYDGALYSCSDFSTPVDLK